MFEESQSYALDSIKSKRKFLTYLIAVPLFLPLLILLLLIALGAVGFMDKVQIHQKDEPTKEITIDDIRWQKSSFEWVLLSSIAFSYGKIESVFFSKLKHFF